MNIKKMLLAAVMALAAIAFAAPAAAQAENFVTLTDPEGTPLAGGAKVTATSTNLVTTTGGGDGLQCELVSIHLEVKQNGLNQVVLAPTGAVPITTEGCNTISGLPVTITAPSIQNLTLNKSGTGETEATFVSDIFAPGGHTELLASCHFVGDVHVQGTDTTDIVHVGPSVLAETGAEGCPPQGTIHGTFTLETTDPNNTPVTIDIKKTP